MGMTAPPASIGVVGTFDGQAVFDPVIFAAEVHVNAAVADLDKSPRCDLGVVARPAAVHDDRGVLVRYSRRRRRHRARTRYRGGEPARANRIHRGCHRSAVLTWSGNTRDWRWCCSVDGASTRAQVAQRATTRDISKASDHRVGGSSPSERVKGLQTSDSTDVGFASRAQRTQRLWPECAQRHDPRLRTLAARPQPLA